MKVLVVYKKSTFELYSVSSDIETRDFVQGKHEDAQKTRASHKVQKKTLKKVISKLKNLGVDHQLVYRADLNKIKDWDFDLIISVGGDGTFLEVSHYVKDTPVLGVNSDPENSVGYFCVANPTNFDEVIAKIDQLPKTKLNRLKILINGKELPELALNDIFFAHPNPAATTRYILENEEFKGSGLLACTSAGSSAWIYQENGERMPTNSLQIQYLHRGIRNRNPKLTNELKITSLTRQGKLYIDGPHLSYNLGLGDSLIIKKGTPLAMIGKLS